MTDKKPKPSKKRKHGTVFNLVRDVARKVVAAMHYKQYRDETTGRFIGKEQADKQAGKGNVMLHTVKRKSRRTH